MSIFYFVEILLPVLLWGGTNPFIKRASKNISSVKANTKIEKFYKEFIHLFTNTEYIIPFALNQCGSAVYIYSLQHTELSFIVPVTNSLTLVFTAICGWIIGEERPSLVTIIGMLFVMLGTYMCWMDKS